MEQARLADRRIVVVGAGTQPSDEPDPPMGNGRAIAVRVAAEGAAVVCVDRDRAAAQDTAALIGDAATVVVADVAVEDDCARLVADAGSPIDGLVLNVGIGRGVGLIGTTAHDWDTTFAVNLRSHFLIS